MMAMIERVKQHLSLRSCAPMIMLVVTIPTAHPDPINKRTGYAGVLPVPAAPSPASNARIDPLLGGKRDSRSDRGRVLYAAGHAPRDTMAAHARTLHKPCPEQRLVESNTRTSSPNT
jgi:hypothetical protein